MILRPFTRADILPVLRLQYKDYALWQEGMRNREIRRRQEAGWIALQAKYLF